MSPARRPSPLRLGFVALTDAAPLIVAYEHGHFARRGLNVVLSREIGWATVRDKVIYGELDGSHALAGTLFSAQLGLDCPATEVLTALVLNLHGNAVTLSRALWDAGVRDAHSLRAEVRRRRGQRRLTFGVVFPFSTHHLMLRVWLRRARIDPETDVRIVIVPPAQMFRNLAAGTIDGYCVGEPWNSLAVQQGSGWIPTWSAQECSGQIEKVFMVRRSFAETRASEHQHLVAALFTACAWCDEPKNRRELAALLARPGYLNVSAATLAPALTGEFDDGCGRIVQVPDFLVFHRRAANVPAPAQGAALISQYIAAGLLPTHASEVGALAARLFREDIFAEATGAAPVVAP